MVERRLRTILESLSPPMGLAARALPVDRMGSAERRSPFAGGGLASKPLRPCTRWGVQRGEAPLPGGTGVSPVLSFITPFLARKGDGGIVETAVGHRPQHGSGC